MRKNGKKVLSMLLMLAIVLAMLPDGAFAAEIVDSGEYSDAGTKVAWTVDANGTLTISGNGEVLGRSLGQDVPNVPWRIHEYGRTIKNIVIQNGITSIQWYAFSACTDLMSVTIPESVTGIEIGAFQDCSRLSDVYYTGTKAQWSQIDIDTGLDRNASLLNATTHCRDGVIPPAGIIPTESRCGDNLTWELGNDGTFTIQGTGEMWEFDITCPAPWWRERSDSIKRIFVKEGVTSIGRAAFGGMYDTANYTGLTSMTFPSSLIHIAAFAFDGCYNLKDIYYSGSEAQWEQIHIDKGDETFTSNGPLFNAAVHYNSDTVIDESILKARLLLQDNPFSFYRKWKSPVQTMAAQLNSKASIAWYYTDNLLDAYYKSFKQADLTVEKVAEVTDVEFYEYLLLKLLDSEEMKYLSLTEPFGLIDDISDGAVDSSLLKKLISEGFKAGTKITDENKASLKGACEAICGKDKMSDIGWMDAILVPGKTIDKFASEFVELYQLTTVSDARAEGIRLIGESSDEQCLRIAAQNVYSSIQNAKKKGVEYCVSEGVEQSADYLVTFMLGKVVDGLCDIHPYSAIWKKTADTATFLMNTIFLTDDVSTDVIYITAMANVEDTLKGAIDKAENTFRKEETVENARHLIALADTYKRDLLVGCDLINSLIDHTERGDMNWHGIQVLLAINTGNFGNALKLIFGDKNLSYAELKSSITSIRESIKGTNFYLGTVSAIELLREVKSTIPSTWAKDEVNKAINYGILPEEMQNNYQDNITRLEFCELLSYLIDLKSEKGIMGLTEELTQVKGGPIERPFDDALYMVVNEIAGMGIIKGVGNNKFNPLGEITRQEAAVMLCRTANVLGYDTSADSTGFPGVADWASQGVDFVVTKGIMLGTGNGFEPEGKYTKEQAIITMVRFYEYVL